MVTDPVLPEVLTAFAAMVFGSVLIAGLASVMKSRIAKYGRFVKVKLPSGQRVRLELDSHLSQQEINNLVIQAVSAAASGDDRAVKRSIDDSHEASRKARERLPAA